MVKPITFRAVIEVLGKPQEHVDKAIHQYVDALKASKEYTVIHEEFADIKKQEEQELWSVFAELEVKTEKLENLTSFCFEYMPSLIEVLEPQEFNLTDVHFSQFLNDLQAKLHNVDMVAKQVKLENDQLKRNMKGLLQNYIQVLLGNRRLTSTQLSQMTGVDKERIEDFLDMLIDDGKVDLEEGVYFLRRS